MLKFSTNTKSGKYLPIRKLKMSPFYDFTATISVTNVAYLGLWQPTICCEHHICTHAPYLSQARAFGEPFSSSQICYFKKRNSCETLPKAQRTQGLSSYHKFLVNLVNMSLACEDSNSKLVEVYSATYSVQFLKVMKSFSRLESHS